jgi:hypothetical protein
MKQYDESRTSLFQRIDRPALQPLRECAYQYTYIKNVRVNIDRIDDLHSEGRRVGVRHLYLLILAEV